MMRKFSAISLSVVMALALAGAVWFFMVAADGPGIVIIAPAPGSTVDTVQPAIRGSFTDRGNGVDPLSIQALAAFPIHVISSNETGFLATPNTALAQGGTFSVTVSVADLAGSVTTVTWDFTVAADAGGDVFLSGKPYDHIPQGPPGADDRDYTPTP